MVHTRNFYLTVSPVRECFCIEIYPGHIMALQVAPALKTSGNETNANLALLQFSVYNYTSILEIKGKGLVKRRWHLRWRLLYLPLELRKVPIEKVHL